MFIVDWLLRHSSIENQTVRGENHNQAMRNGVEACDQAAERQTK